jgi:hypothetical protein
MRLTKIGQKESRDEVILDMIRLRKEILELHFKNVRIKDTFKNLKILSQLMSIWVLIKLLLEIKNLFSMGKSLMTDVCKEARKHALRLQMYKNERNSLIKLFLPKKYANTTVLIKEVTSFIFKRMYYYVKYGYLSCLILIQKMLFHIYNTICIDQITSQSLYDRKLNLRESLYLFLLRKFQSINWLDVIKRLTPIFNLLFMVILIQSSTSILEILLEVKEIPEIYSITHLVSLILISWIFIKFIHFFRKFKSVTFVTLLIFVLLYSLYKWSQETI